MKNKKIMKHMLACCLFLFICLGAGAQHGIRLTSGHYLVADSVLLGSTEVQYRSNGLFKSVANSEVAWVRFGNGTVFRINDMPKHEEYVSVPAAPAEAPATNSKDCSTPECLYQKGKQDAQLYYDPKGARNGTAALTAIPFPMLGLVSASVISLTPAKPNVVSQENRSLLNDRHYRRGYSDGARPEKTRGTWKGFLVGGALKLAGAFVLATMTMSQN